MPLGTPAVPAIRTNDVKSLQNAFVAVTERLRAIEAALGLVPGQFQGQLNGATSLFQVLATQADGLVVKANGVLVTRVLSSSDGITVTNPTGAAGNPVLNAPLLADIVAQPDGFVVKTGDDAVTRVLIDGSGSGITITDPDGVAGDPSFSVP